MQLKFWRGELKLTHKWRIARGSASIIHTLFVELRDSDGVVGYGESAPSSRYEETLESVEAYLQKIDPNRLNFDDLESSRTYLAGIAPGKKGGHIARARLDRLAEAVKAVLIAAIRAGGSTLRDYVQPNGELGYFSAEWRVYGREGDPCPNCGATIRRRVDNGRSTFYCGKCQR